MAGAPGAAAPGSGLEPSRYGVKSVLQNAHDHGHARRERNDADQGNGGKAGRRSARSRHLYRTIAKPPLTQITWPLM